MPVTNNCVMFIGCNFGSRASQVGLHKQKKDSVSAKEGKVSLLHRGGQNQGCAVTYGSRLLEVTKTWPQVTENIVQFTHLGNMLVLVS